MKTAAFLALLVTSVQGAAIAKKPTPEGVLVADVKHVYSDTHPLPSRNARQYNAKEAREQLAQAKAVSNAATTPSVSITNEFAYYEINVNVGTPAQAFQCLLDTGSSDLWVSSSSNPDCAAVDCSEYGTFTQSKSSTFHLNSSSAHDNAFAIEYADGSFAQGSWGYDTVGIGGQVSLTQCSVAVAAKANSSNPVLGIGLTSLESTNDGQLSGQGGQSYTYPNVPQLMYQRGLIGTNAYSLYLNDLNANTGKIIFGGYDTCAYTGALTTVPLVETYSTVNTPVELAIGMTGFSILSSSGSSQYSKSVSYAALLDSGTTLMYLSNTLANQLYSKMGAVANNQVGYYVAPCSTAGSLQFSFGSASINVPYSEILLELTDQNGNAYTENGVAQCAVGVFGIATTPGYQTEVILGDTFLRSAYVVYDLHNKQISLAKPNYNPSCSSISAIPLAGL